ncbi:MAG TPA: sigma 54-interacting transcriptional regulator [Terriglobales bacterium]|nr:sigma 54-interacting transcriptional regulator [Terriglobales bacterium]
MATVARVIPADLSGRYEALLRAGRSIATCNDCENAGSELSRHLREIIFFDYLQVVVFNAQTDAVEWQMLEVNGERLNVLPRDQDTPLVCAHKRQELYLVDDWSRETQFSSYKQFLGQHGIASTCALPLNRGSRRLGVISVGRRRPHSYPNEEVDFLRLVADQVALAIDAAVNLYTSTQAQERLKLILELTNQVVSNLEFDDLLHAISSIVRRVMHCDAAAIMLPDAEGKNLRVHTLDFPDSWGLFKEGGEIPIEGSMPGRTLQTGEPFVLNRLDPETTAPEMYAKASGEGIKSLCDIGLVSRNRVLGVMALARRQENTFDDDEVVFLTQVAHQVAIAMENALAYGEIAELKDRLAQEKLYLEDEIRGEMDFEGIVGQSSALRNVLRLVETVAPSDSTVLLLGETGTGKELIARAIHDRSRRKDRTFVKLNCAAIPTGLLESELFGHERGAFTGAITQKLGRLELADQGTLFLDEVGDIPLEIQPKLLRALQEREFERLGSTRTKKVDVRLVAATNRNLDKMIEDREFRSDLYYRLNVFPIRIPPLRERPEDIPLLVRYFAQKYGRRMEKKIESIPAAALKQLANWNWPGNIRELENFIERAVILTHGTALEVPVSELRRTGAAVSPPIPRESHEHDEILRVLRETRGRVAGPNGAATRMGIKRTTLISRMKKLGIDPRKVS